MNDVLVIIPTYNEITNIAAITEAVTRHDVDILFVDDNSPDRTGYFIDGLTEIDDRINVIHRDKRYGMGKAYVEGFKWAIKRKYNLIFEMDADLSHDPADIPRFIEEMKGHELVIGSRYLGGQTSVVGWPIRRLLLSKAASLYVRFLTGMKFTDPTSGYKCYKRRVLESLDLDNIKSKGYAFQIETVYKAWKKKFIIHEIPIIFRERSYGESKMNVSIISEALRIIWNLRKS